MLSNLGRSPRLGGLCLTGVCLGLVLLLAVGGHAAAQPLGWWTFDANQVKGATVVDRAGKHDGSIQGEIRLTQRPFAALALDGEANSIDVPNVQAADLPARALSIEAWVSLDAGLAWGGIASFLTNFANSSNLLFSGQNPLSAANTTGRSPKSFSCRSITGSVRFPVRLPPAEVRSCTRDGA